MTEWKSTLPKNPNLRCEKCNSNNIKYRIVEDDYGHEDYHLICQHCETSWWREGADY